MVYGLLENALISNDLFAYSVVGATSGRPLFILCTDFAPRVGARAVHRAREGIGGCDSKSIVPAKFAADPRLSRRPKGQRRPTRGFGSASPCILQKPKKSHGDVCMRIGWLYAKYVRFTAVTTGRPCNGICGRKKDRMLRAGAYDPISIMFSRRLCLPLTERRHRARELCRRRCPAYRGRDRIPRKAPCNCPPARSRRRGTQECDPRCGWWKGGAQ